MSIAFKQVDVFTSKPFKGNPVAVTLDGSQLSTEQMQTIANWTYLSETTFALPAENPEASYKLRIFTPYTELPFAGHPTVGSAHALLEAGIVKPLPDGYLVQECKAGLIKIKVEDGKEPQDRLLTIRIPDPKFEFLEPSDIDILEQILGQEVDRNLTPAVVDVGPKWLTASLKSGESVLDVKPDFLKEAELENKVGALGITIFGPYDTKGEPFERIEVRSFAPQDGVPEDPVCGSGHGAVGSFLRYHKTKIPANNKISSTQGTKCTRDGYVTLTVTEEGIFVAGNAVTCIDGSIKV